MLHTSDITRITLDGLGELARVSWSNLDQYYNDLAKPIISLLIHFVAIEPATAQTVGSSQTYLIHSALRTLGIIIQATGVVVSPLSQFPQLLPTLLAFLLRPSSMQLFKEAFRLIGIIGPISPLNASKILALSSPTTVPH